MTATCRRNSRCVTVPTNRLLDLIPRNQLRLIDLTVLRSSGICFESPSFTVPAGQEVVIRGAALTNYRMERRPCHHGKPN